MEPSILMQPDQNVIGVTENLASILESLAASAVEAARDPGSVGLLAVSKKKPVEAVVADVRNR